MRMRRGKGGKNLKLEFIKMSHQQRNEILSVSLVGNPGSLLVRTKPFTQKTHMLGIRFALTIAIENCFDARDEAREFLF